MKRITPLLLALCLTVSMMPTVLAAGTELKVNAPKELPAVGETFTVTVDISGNPVFFAVDLNLGYDTSVVECVAVATGSVLKGAMAATNPAAATGAIVSAATLSPTKEDGTLATYTFRVVGSGDSGIQLTDSFLGNVDGEEYSHTVVNANVASKPGTTPAPKPTTKPEVIEPVLPMLPEEEESFTDTAGHAYEDYIDRAVELGLFQGYEDGSFGPERSVTRGAYVTVLWRMAGRPQPRSLATFPDIGGLSQEFQTAIAWAYENQMISGYEDGTFGPGKPVSRQAALKILYYYNGGVNNVNPLYLGLYQDGFEDCKGKPEWVQTSMFWGYYNQLIDPATETTLQPAVDATRAQLAKMFVTYTDVFGSR